ncbi:MAG: SPOR domain-containing protein [Rhodospirillaceae bacterium]
MPDDVAADGAPPAGSGEAGSATLSYAERLGKTPPAETLKVAPEAQRPRVEVPPEVPGEPLGPPPVASAVPATAAAAAPADPAPGLYTVQVAAMTRRDEAEAIARQLKAKGYDAYVFVPEGSEGRGGFRVRIGAFKDKRQADLLAERLLREEKRYKPWVTR